MTGLSHHAQRALDFLDEQPDARIIRTTERGMSVWREGFRVKGLGRVWSPDKKRPGYMYASIQELLSAGLVVRDGPDMVRKPPEAE